MSRRALPAGLACFLLLSALTACNGGGGGAGERPTLSPTISPTRTPEGPTRTPTRTNEATEQPTEDQTERPTERPTEQPTEQPTEHPSPTRTAPPTQSQAPPATSQPAPETSRPESPKTTSPTRTAETTQPTAEQSAPPQPTKPAPSPTPQPSPTEVEPTPVAQSEPADDGVPAWLWWLLAAVVVALAILAWALLARARRRRAWQEQMQAAQAEVAWMARELLPQLRSTGSVDGVTGGWQVGLPRVTAAEDQLTVLESSARDDGDRARAHGLRDAVRTVRAKVEALATDRPHDTWAQDLDEAIATLESALAPPQPAETPL